MNDNLASVTRTLHDLIRSLPAMRGRCAADVLERHVALIAHYQRRYDRLAGERPDGVADRSAHRAGARLAVDAAP